MPDDFTNQDVAALKLRELLPQVITDVAAKINTPGTPEHDYVNAPTYNPE